MVISAAKASTTGSSPASWSRGICLGLSETSAEVRVGRQHHAQGAAGEGEQQALGQGLPHQAHAAGTQRGPDGVLPAASHPRGEHEVGQVGAADQEHQRHRREQQREERAVGADQLVGHRPDQDAPPVGVDGEALVECPRQRGELGGGAGDRGARRETGDDPEELQLTVRRASVPFQREGRGQLGRALAGKDEAARQHTHHLVALLVEHDVAAHDVGAGPEAPPPEAVGDQDHVRARLYLRLGEGPPDHGQDAQHLPETDSGAHRGNALGLVGAGEVDRAGGVRREGHRACSRAELAIVGDGERIP